MMDTLGHSHVEVDMVHNIAQCRYHINMWMWAWLCEQDWIFFWIFFPHGHNILSTCKTYSSKKGGVKFGNIENVSYGSFGVYFVCGTNEMNFKRFTCETLYIVLIFCFLFFFYALLKGTLHCIVASNDNCKVIWRLNIIVFIIYQHLTNIQYIIFDC
jgi:hypothetical protein